MVTTIQQSLHPLLFMWFIVGLGIYPVKKSKQKNRRIVYLSIFYSLTLWFTYGYFFYYIVNIFTFKGIYYTTSTIIVILINILATITSAIVCLYHQKKFELCMKKLAAVDNTLEKLGIPKMYQKMHMWSKRVVIAWIVYSIVINFFDMIWWYKVYKTIVSALLVPYILNYHNHINAFMDLIVIFFLWYIGIEFDKISEIICLLIKEEHKLKCTWKTVNVRRYTLCNNNYKQTLWISMHLYLELCRTARELNLMFGMQLTLEMISYLLYLTVICYYLCLLFIYQRKFMSYNDFISFSGWFFICLIRIIIVNYVFERVKAKADKIGKIIYQLTTISRYVDFYMEIYQFTLQTMQQPFKFTGMGLFNFGNVFLGKFCMTLIMYVIIMVQMRIS